MVPMSQEYIFAVGAADFGVALIKIELLHKTHKFFSKNNENEVVEI